MTYQIGTRDQAQAVANAHGPVEVGAGRRWVRNDVRQHGSGPRSFGIVPQWVYEDQPHLGVFGGEFAWFDPATAKLGKWGEHDAIGDRLQVGNVYVVKSGMGGSFDAVLTAVEGPLAFWRVDMPKNPDWHGWRFQSRLDDVIGPKEPAR
ncbi:hypothetical protein [Brevundimonas sp.]|uniref:hypothetical protein n=1 Tax=Brevundimonas sp. TaxID=1871086 RepID=UPI0035ADC747